MVNDENNNVTDSIYVEKGNILKRIFRTQQSALFLALIVLVVTFTVVSYFVRGEQVFFTTKNLFNILLQSSLIGIAAIGCTTIIVAGEIDLSIGSLQAVVGLAAVFFANLTGSMWVGLLAGLMVGFIVGSINSFIVLKMKVNSLIATLAMMIALRGLVYVITGGKSIQLAVKWLNWLGTGYISIVPVPVIIIFVLYAVFYFILSKTPFGRYIYAVGGNRRATLLAGINANKIKFAAFIISGILAAIAGVVLAARLNSSQPRSAAGFELNVIAATIFGGTSLSGGRGNLIGTILGVITLGVLLDGLIIFDVNPFYQEIVRGIILILAVFFDQLRRGQLAREEV
ncbi:MAG: ABC transporter permease [Actinobacteria bacterium]|nr:ABC transporter permease [Actinomycetota bacterium]